MTIRPLSSFGIDQMESYADSFWYSLAELQKLKHELLFRNSSTYPRVRDLQFRIQVRISRLQQIHEVLAPCLQHKTFRDWFYEPSSMDDVFKEAVVHGSSPVGEYELVDLLEKHNVEYAGAFRGDVETLILGREGWDSEDVVEQLDLRTDKTIRAYSQEMALAFLACGKDPLCGDKSLLDFFSYDHSGLKFLKAIGFPWPSTEVFPGSGNLGYSVEADWPKIGLLSYMGYRVGRNGKREGTRRAILSEVFEKEVLPKVDSPEYIEEWGPARSSQRLMKMAESIASFARNRKRNDPLQFSKAIDEWEADLEWLKLTFYRGHHRFQWPSTIV